MVVPYPEIFRIISSAHEDEQINLWEFMPYGTHSDPADTCVGIHQMRCALFGPPPASTEPEGYASLLALFAGHLGLDLERLAPVQTGPRLTLEELESAVIVAIAHRTLARMRRVPREAMAATLGEVVADAILGAALQIPRVVPALILPQRSVHRLTRLLLAAISAGTNLCLPLIPFDANMREARLLFGTNRMAQFGRTFSKLFWTHKIGCLALALVYVAYLHGNPEAHELPPRQRPTRPIPRRKSPPPPDRSGRGRL